MSCDNVSVHAPPVVGRNTYSATVSLSGDDASVATVEKTIIEHPWFDDK